MTADKDISLSPLSLWKSALFFAIPTLLMWAATQYGIPLLRGRIAGPDVLCWFIAGGSVFVLLFVAALICYWSEAQQGSASSFAERFWLHRLSWADLSWSVGVLFGCVLLSLLILVGWTLLSSLSPLIERPNLHPPFLQMEPLTPDTFWVLLAWLPLFFFNIAGEELWWRGYMLPRQVQAHGQMAWIVHGLGLIVFHLPFGVHVTIMALPVLFGLPFVVQKRRNLWTGILVHGVFNGLGFLAVAFGWG